MIRQRYLTPEDEYVTREEYEELLEGMRGVFDKLDAFRKQAAYSGRAIDDLTAAVAALPNWMQQVVALQEEHRAEVRQVVVGQEELGRLLRQLIQVLRSLDVPALEALDVPAPESSDAPALEPPES